MFVNTPLRDYTQRPRVNDFTLPVLGMGYLATYAATQGFNVGVLDAEAHGLGLSIGIDLINSLAPRWVGFNLLAGCGPVPGLGWEPKRAARIGILAKNAVQDAPEIDEETYMLEVGGLVDNKKSWTLEELYALPQEKQQLVARGEV